MARAEPILNLVKASRQGDEQQVRKPVDALAAEERAKNHAILANRLLAQHRSEARGRFQHADPPVERPNIGHLVADVEDFGFAVLRNIVMQRPRSDVKGIEYSSNGTSMGLANGC